MPGSAEVKKILSGERIKFEVVIKGKGEIRIGCGNEEFSASTA